MIPSRLFAFLIGAISLLVAPCGAAPGKPLPALAVVRTAGVTSSGPVTAHCSVGLLDPLQTPQITRTFTLQNVSSTPITIERTGASCGCTTLLLGKETGAAPRVLGPGDRMELKATIDLTALRPGPLHKSLWVYLRGAQDPALTVEVVGTLQESITIDPESVAFGGVERGQTPQKTLVLHVDRRLLSRGEIPPLVSANPRIVRVTPVDTDARDPAAARLLTRRYTVTLAPDAPLGLFSAKLSFVPRMPSPGDKDRHGSDPSAAQVASIFAGIAIPVTAEVRGNFSATPGSVAFGIIAVGKKARRKTTINGKTAEALADLRAASDNSWFTARVVAADPGSDRSAILEVLLDPRAPQGSLQGQVSLTNASGETLLIPVSAFITQVTASPEGEK